MSILLANLLYDLKCMSFFNTYVNQVIKTLVWALSSYYFPHSHFFPHLEFPVDDRRFSYDAPMQWQYIYPLCGGSDQSPISLSAHKVIPIGLPPLHFGLYEEPFDDLLVLRNNGHTGMLDGIQIPINIYVWIYL